MDTRLQNQAKTSSATSVSPVQTGLFQPRPFTDSEQEAAEASDSFHQPSSLQTQLELASRFGHNFSRVQVQTNTPSAIQTQLLNRQPEEQQDEEEANGVAEPLKMMAPPVGEPIEPESPEESIQMMPQWGKLTPAIQRQDQEEEPIQMMPQLGLLAPVIQRQEQEEESIQMMPQLGLFAPAIQRQDQEEPIQMMPQWGMLQRSPQEEEDLPMQMMPQWGVIQRQETEGEEEPLQMKWLQAKLVVGAPGDKYEQEADSVAAQVMSMSLPEANPGLVQRQGEEEEQTEPLVQRSPLADSITPLVQRQTEEQEEAIQAKSLLQRAGNGNAQAGNNVESQLNQSKGGGSPLPDEVRSFMEPRFGTDFSSVRVHTDSTAVQMNKDLRAQAFAHGSDIYYGAGKSPAQDSLTAHELTHVVQQTGAKKLQRSPILTRKENKEALQPLTPNQELRHSPLEAKPGEIEESHNTLQAKKLPHPMSAVSWYKEQQSSVLEEEEAKKPAEPKQISGGNPEHALEENSHIEENVKKWGDKAVAKAKPQIDIKEAKSKTELASEAAKEIKTAGKPDSTAAKTDSALSEHQVKSVSKVGTPESDHSVAGKADAGKSAAPVVPATHKEVTPDSKAATSPPPQAVAQKAQTEHKPKDQPAAEAATAAPASTSPVVAAPPALESGGGTVEEASDNGTSGVEEEIAAAAEQAPPGSAELEPAERDAALASLAEGSGAGGEAVGGGGGGGGAAIADKPTPPAPNVSQAEPSAALAAVSNLPPAQLLGALGGVGAAVGTSVGKQRAELAANPPQMERPTGSPMTNEGLAADRATPSGKNPKAVAKTPEGQAKPVPQPKPVALSSTPPVAKVPQPQVKGDAEGKLDAGDAQKLQASLRSLPTSDPGLQQVSASAPPHLELQGNADPQQAQQQRGELEKGIADAHSKGQQELAQPMGENEIYPKVPQETLRAEGIGGGGGAAGGAAAKAAGGAAAGGGGEAGDEAVSIIAQQEHGQQIQAGVAKAQAEIAAKRQEHSTKVEEEKARSHQEIAQLQTENSAQQATERAKAQAEVQQQRSAWQKEQDTLITKSRKDADEAVSKGNKDVQQEQTQAETKASEHIQKGEEEAAAARQKGEQEAEKERQKGEEESGGILGWLADKAKAFFDGIKQAIQKAFEVARAAVKATIEGAQKLATAVIETARQAIVGIIKAVGAALIAIGDVLLAAFPEMRDRFRNAITGVVKAAETAVDALADTLKKGVQAALNLLGKGLDAALGLLEKGMMAAVDIAKAAVQGAIKLADAAIKAIGAFAVLVKDVAANPSQWLSNLGAGANDGIKNHFWGAFQTAVKEWFSQKVEEVLGLGMTVWNVLKQGGINTAEIGKMAWEGIKSAIPAVLIGLLIEKVVSMIVPAAGTVLLIIEGLQAAWGTVSRILQAFERFMAFLKAVKTGQAGPPFGAALAAAGVVVIDFVSNWLLKRLRGPASKVAGKIKEIAKKIGKKVKKAVKKLGKKFGKLKEKLFGKKGKKDKKRDKDKANKSADHAKLKKAADKAAKAGWNKARKASSKEVISAGKLESILTQAGNSKAKGIHVTLSAVPQGENWSVKAVAQGEGGSATANAGRGTILRDPQQRPWYSANSLDGLSKKLINEAVQKLTAQTQPKESGDLQQEYQEKRRLARKLEQDGTRQLNQKAHGVRMTITMEPFSGAEKDKQIKTKITVAPNTETHELQVPLTVSDPDFAVLAQKLNAEVVGKQYNLPDMVVLAARRAAHKAKFKKVDWNTVADPPTGGYIHTLVFHHPTQTGKSQSWFVAKVAGDSNCPACGNAIGPKPPQQLANEQAQNPNVDVRNASRPHFFIPESKLKDALGFAVNAIGAKYTGTDAALYANFRTQMSQNSILKNLVGPRTPAALSGRRNSTVTDPDQQMQCRVCEDTGQHAHGSFTLKERLERAKTPAALPSGADKDAHVGKQVGGANLSKKDERDITTQRLHLQIYPHVENLLSGGIWPTGMSRFGGDRNKQIAEFMRAFNSATKAYR